MINLLYFLSSIIECFLITRFLKSFSEANFIKTKVNSFFLFISIFFIFMLNLYSNILKMQLISAIVTGLLLTASLYIIFVIYLKSCKVSNIYTIFYLSLFCITILLLSYSFSIILIGVIFDKSLSFLIHIETTPNILLIRCALNLITIFCECILFKITLGNLKYIKLLDKVCISNLVISHISLIILLQLYIGSMYFWSANIMEPFLSIVLRNIFLFIIIISILKSYSSFERLILTVTKLNLKLEQQKLEQQYNTEVINAYKEMKSLNHDWKNHMHIILNMYNNNDFENAKKYIDRLEIESSMMNYVVFSGNSVIDSIVTNKYMLATQKDIKFEINISLEKTLPIDSFDLSTILINCLDNSIEACEKVSSNKFINLTISTVKDNLLISILNSSNKDFNLKNNNFLTTKLKPNHGIGLGRIDHSVNKYNGSVNRYYKNSIFKTIILIPIS